MDEMKMDETKKRKLYNLVIALCDKEEKLLTGADVDEKRKSLLVVQKHFNDLVIRSFRDEKIEELATEVL